MLLCAYSCARWSPACARVARAGLTARLGVVAFIHQFGSTLNPHLHFHCVVIDGVFDAAAAGGVVFHADTGLDATAIAEAQAQVRRHFAHASSCGAACGRPITQLAIAQ